MSRSERDSHVTGTAGTAGTRPHRSKHPRPVETIRVRVAPVVSPEAARATIGQLVEEWAALTYVCMVEAAVAAQAANQPMNPSDEPVPDVPATAVGGE